MKNGVLLASLVFLCVVSGSANARDSKNMYSIDHALNSALGQSSLSGDIKLYFGTDNHPAVGRTIGNYMSNKKTNGVGKTDEAACERAFLSAMITFRDRAIKEGGNAVVNLTSYYKKNAVSSATEFECGSGAIMSGVTMRGDVVTLK